ncbi:MULTISPECIES: hypothetical protein [Okeania]|uniref:Uncharacterized protein n=1 Tax=Okeania hirsuta TaxID=1458930 RepID=A0A3N6RJJ8_9CYAN|nr:MULTISPECIES: hypothetical protein [Okeania]NES74452.1 hypothetical protein [Okeania sp. SIO1H4]NES91152.1 hypothetical protein [Okeania sp. SIO2B9]NET18065.1 hypothetical protein [Okeania sp. SIO1H5]NET96834.1 hypothetical protein [Okeania sp. SIO1H2]RQH14430.1 hypothetical protein D4Z78_22735 [Okeania hirsuta]
MITVVEPAAASQIGLENWVMENELKLSIDYVAYPGLVEIRPYGKDKSVVGEEVLKECNDEGGDFIEHDDRYYCLF